MANILPAGPHGPTDRMSPTHAAVPSQFDRRKPGGPFVVTLVVPVEPLDGRDLNVWHHLHVRPHKSPAIVRVVLAVLLITLGLAGLVTAKSPNLQLIEGGVVLLSVVLLVLAVRSLRR
jgi:hypothetical protein